MDRETQEKSVRICTTCNKRIAEEGSASLSQWIYSHNRCTCRSKLDDLNRSAQELDYDSIDELVICRKCSRKIKEAVEGSLTQWIFQSHICDCEEPEPVTVKSEKTPVKDAVEVHAAPPLQFTPDEKLLAEWDPELERYAPVKIIGTGGSGTVYLCFDQYLQKVVVLKSLNLATDRQLVNFQKEAKIASRLNHHCIVRVMDFGVTGGGTPYMVMDYVDGVSLEKLLREKSGLEALEALRLMIFICDALVHAHMQEVLHHDIKSSNIVVAVEDERLLKPCLIDFGVARLINQDLEDEERVGSYPYMAPEYSSGGEYDIRCEIYALGCLFFELITGSLPYERETVLELLEAHAESEIPTLSQFIEPIECAPRFQEILENCLAKDPADRFQSVLELQDALERLDTELATTVGAVAEQGDEVISARVPVLESKSSIDSISSSRLLFSLAIGMIVIAGGVGVIFWSNLKKVEKIETGKFNTYIEPKIEAPSEEVYRRSYEPEFHLNSLGFVRSEDPIKDEDIKFALKKFPNAKKWDLHDTDVTGNCLKYLAPLKPTDINLSRTVIDGESLSYLGQTQSLSALNLGTCERLRDTDLRRLKSLTKLTSLKISGAGITNGVCKELAGLSSLKSIGLKSLELKPADIKAMKNLDLKAIRLDRMKIDSDLADTIGKTFKLVNLSLVDCRVTDGATSRIAESKSLKELELPHSVVSQRGLLALRKLKLKYLNLKGVPLHDYTEEQLKQSLRNCRIKN